VLPQGDSGRPECVRAFAQTQNQPNAKTRSVTATARQARGNLYPECTPVI